MLTKNEFYEKKEQGAPELQRYDCFAHYAKENVGVGDGITVHLYTDSDVYTVIRRTRTSLTLQEDDAQLDPSFKPEFIPGGFAAHCTNQDEQKWTYKPDPNGRVTTAHWSEKNKAFMVERSCKCTYGRHKYFDWNF